MYREFLEKLIRRNKGEKMEIKNEFIELIKNCNWFENCGDGFFKGFDVVMITNKNEVVKKINSLKWENTCLEKRGDFTFFLSQNYKEQYNKFWNKEIEDIKRRYMGGVSKKCTAALLKKDLPLDIVNDIKFNVLTLFMLNYYSEYYFSDFFDQMLQIYLSGHLPCGWSGNLKDGKFIVY